MINSGEKRIAKSDHVTDIKQLRRFRLDNWRDTHKTKNGSDVDRKKASVIQIDDEDEFEVANQSESDSDIPQSRVVASRLKVQDNQSSKSNIPIRLDKFQAMEQNKKSNRRKQSKYENRNDVVIVEDEDEDEEQVVVEIVDEEEEEEAQEEEEEEEEEESSESEAEIEEVVVEVRVHRDKSE